MPKGFLTKRIKVLSLHKPIPKCMKRVDFIIKQNSRWDITTTHYFTHRFYQVDEDGNFFRNGKIVAIKPDSKNNLFVLLIDDNGERIRCKIHQIVYQTFSDEKIIPFHSVDHISRNRLDNSYKNLRLASRKMQFDNRENKAYKYKKVLCLNNETIYNSCQKAEIDLGLIKNTVSRVARGDRKSIHVYIFNFIE